MNIGIIGAGAIGSFVRDKSAERGYALRAVLVRPERLRERAAETNEVLYVDKVSDVPGDIDCMIDCAGHSALIDHGAGILRGGTDLITVSLGALADAALYERLEGAASEGNSTLHLASGAIGSLDCLQAAKIGTLQCVTYVGRKPPRGWQGSPAETKLDLDNLGDKAAVHFEGPARIAAMEYPKNANVAAAVALAGIGFDATEVQLIADPGVSANIHEVRATGEFGSFSFEVHGRSLSDNPRSSALAAMSVIAKLEQISQSVRF